MERECPLEANSQQTFIVSNTAIIVAVTLTRIFRHKKGTTSTIEILHTFCCSSCMRHTNARAERE